MVVPSITLTERFNSDNATRIAFNKSFRENNKSLARQLAQLASRGSYSVTYSCSNELGVGRFTATTDVPEFKHPAVYMKREVRGSLFSHCEDLDFKNCHPTILVQLCRTHNIPCATLETYVLDSQALRDRVAAACNVAVEDAKVLMAAIMFGGSIQSWCDHHSVHVSAVPAEVISMHREVQSILPIITRHHPKFAEYATKQKQQQADPNKPSHPTLSQVYRSTMAYVLQTIERECITVLVELAQRDGFEVCSIIYDGILTYKREDGVSPTDFFPAWSNGIKDKTGYYLELSKKPMEPCPALLSDVSSLTTELQQLIQAAIKTPLDGVLADLLHHMLGDQYVFPVKGKRLCYHFDEARSTLWDKCNSDSGFELDVHRHVLPLFQDLLDDTRQEQAVAAADGDKSKWKLLESKCSTIWRIMQKLNESSKLHSLVNAYCSRSQERHPNFLSKLDQNPSLIGFSNGVLDLDAKCFRKGRPEDYISMSVGYDYLQRSDPQIREELTAIVSSLFDSDEMSEYFLNVCAYCLSGNKHMEEYYILTGSGRNGKSLMMDLLQYTLGRRTATDDRQSGYFHTAPPGFAAVKNFSPDSPSPSNMMLKGTLVVCVSEPDGQLNTAFLKRVSGRDDMSARALYGDLQEFKPRVAIMFCCNRVPDMPKFGVADQKRIRVIHFPHTFTENPTLEHERQIDSSLKQKFEGDVRYRQEFLLMLAERLFNHNIDKSAFHTPDQVKLQTSNLMRDNNPVADFIEAGIQANVLQRCGPNGEVLAQNLIGMFNEYRELQGDKPISKEEFKKRARDADLEFHRPSKRVAGKKHPTKNPEWDVFKKIKLVAESWEVARDMLL